MLLVLATAAPQAVAQDPAEVCFQRNIGSNGEVRTTEGGDPAEFPVDLRGDAITQDLTVPYTITPRVVSSPAREPAEAADFVGSLSGTLTFTPGGGRRKTIEVEIKDDDVYEPWEAYTVTLGGSNLAGGEACRVAHGRITENDPRQLSAPSEIRVKEGMAAQKLKVTLDKPVPHDQEITYEVVESRHLTSTETTGDGGATMADHSMPENGVVTIPAGSLTVSIDIPVVNDSVPEPDEEFFLMLGANQHQTSGGSWYPNIIFQEKILVTIEDDDDPLGRRIVYLQGGSTSPMRTQVEIDEGKSVPVTATLVGTAPTVDTQIPLKFTYFPSAEATSGDYEIPNSITIKAGKNSGSATLKITNDSTDERHKELLAIEIDDKSGSWPDGYEKGDRSRFEVIMVDRQGAGLQLRALSKASLLESDTDNMVTFEIHMDRLPKGNPAGTAPFGMGDDIDLAEKVPRFALNYGGRAQRGTDYTSRNWIPANDADCRRATGITCTVTLTVKNDGLYEYDEDITIALNPGSSQFENGGGFAKKGSDLTFTIKNDDARPMFSIEDAGAQEGAPVRFKVKRASGADENVISVRGATAKDARSGGNPATAGADYPSRSGVSVTLGKDVSEGILSFETTDDALDESAETFQVLLSGAADSEGNPPPGISDGEAIGTITDNDDPPSFSITGGEADEGEAVTFTVTRSGATGNAATVRIATAEDETDGAVAAAADDYTAVDKALTFAGGTTSMAVEVQTTGDDVDEPDEETFLAILSDPKLAAGDPGTGVSIVERTASGTITDNDTATATLVLTPGSINESGASTVTATLSGPSSEAVTLTVSATAVSPAAAGDFSLSANKTLSIAAGATESTGTVTLTAVNNALDAPDKTVTVSATATGGHDIGDPAAVILTIEDDDDAPTVSVADATAVTEGDDPTKTTDMTFTVSLSTASGRTVTVPYTLGGTASGGDDYTVPSPLSVTLAPKATSVDIVVPVKGDGIDEANETVTVTLGAPTHATVSTAEGAGTASGTITDDDERGITVSESALNLAEADDTTSTDMEEHKATYTVVLNSRPTGTVTVSVASGATGVATANPSRLTFAPGAWKTAQTVTVTAVADNIDNPNDERRTTITHTISASGTDYADETAEPVTVTVTDDDDAPTVSVADATAVTEGDDPAKTTDMTFTVSLSTASGRTVTVPYTLGGTASGGDDYTVPALLSVTLAPGDTRTNIVVPVKGDGIDEDDETVTVTLGAPTHATVSTAEGARTASGTITDDDALPVLSIRGTWEYEGNKGTTDLSFPVTLTPASGRTVTVKYADAGTGTATSGPDGDHAALISGTISFAPGETRKNIKVKANGDTDYEPDETIFVRLSEPVNATLSGGKSILAATGWIDNDDAPPPPIIDPDTTTTVEEGETVKFTMTREHDFEPITVSYATSPGPATATYDAATSETDYTAYGADSTETFARREKSITLEFETEDDGLHEASENFTVTISGTGYSETTIVTITDNDPAPKATLTLESSSIGEDDGRSRITASLDRPTSRELRLAVEATPKSDHAIAGDIKQTGRWLTIPAGATASTGIVALTGIDNEADAPDKEFTVSATLFGNADIDDPAAVILTIEDDDDAPTVSVAAATAVTEGDDPMKTTDMTFTVSLSTASGRTVTVPYTLGGTASGGDDYTAPAPLSVTLAPKATSVDIVVPVKGDGIDEDDETVTVTLGSPTNAAVSNAEGAGTASGTITDNDTATATLVLTPGSIDESGDDNASTVTAMLSGPSSAAVTLTVSATAVSPAAAGDFSLSANKTLSIAAGATTSTGTVTLTAVNNTLDAPNASVTVSATATGGHDIDDPAAVTLTIVDDDDAPTVSVADATAVTEGDDPTKTTDMTFTVSLSTASGRTVTVPYTLGGTASGGDDYTAPAPLSVTLAPKATSVDIVVPVKGDGIDEDDETVTVTLGSPTNAAVSNAEGAGTASGTITDNDTATATLVLTPGSIDESGDDNASTVTAMLSGPSSAAVTLTVSATAVSPAAAGDFSLSANKTLSIAAGATTSTGTVTLTAVNNTLDAPNASVTVSATATGGHDIDDPAAVTLTIVDDDDAPTVSVADATAVTEGDDPTKTTDMTFTVSLSTASGRTVTVPYTLGGTASGGDDYTAPAPLSVTLAPKATSVDIVVPVKGDGIDEDDETVTVTLGSPTNAAVSNAEGAGTASGTITDNDTATATLVLTPGSIDESGDDNASTVTAMLSGPSSAAVTLTVSVPENSPVTQSGATLSIAAGATTSTGTVTGRSTRAHRGGQRHRRAERDRGRRRRPDGVGGRCDRHRFHGDR